MPTPNQISIGAAALSGIQDKLGAIIYLLNTSNMTAEQIAAGAKTLGPLAIQDQLGAIIYLLTQFGGGTTGVSSGVGPPTNGVTAGTLYYQTDTKSFWASANNGTTWDELIA